MHPVIQNTTEFQQVVLKVEQAKKKCSGIRSCARNLTSSFFLVHGFPVREVW